MTGTDAGAPADMAKTGGKRGGRSVGLILALLVLGASGTGAANYVFVGGPVSAKLAEDDRNVVFSISAHYANYVQTGTLVLDLTRVGEAAPADLLRGLFQAAETLHAAGRRFDRVWLSRAGSRIFQLSGGDFTGLGDAVAGGENPIYLMRTLPEKLYRPDGTAAFETWTGGVLGVLGRQMEDVTAAATEWAGGTSPP